MWGLRCQPHNMGICGIYLGGEISVETRSPDDEPAEDEGDAQQGE